MTADSVRAIISGRKTQTRKLIEMRQFGSSDTYGYDWTFRDRRSLWNDYTTTQLLESKWCPFQVGTKLWVKEKHAIAGQLVAYDADGWAGAVCEDGGGGLLRLPHGFVSTGGLDSIARGDSEKIGARFGLERFGGRWRAPMCMPRWASRLALEVTSVRVQRLQEICEDDARAEGVDPFFARFPKIGRDQHITTGELARDAEHRASYAVSWDEINGKRALWLTNPWIWAVTFRMAC